MGSAHRTLRPASPATAGAPPCQKNRFVAHANQRHQFAFRTLTKARFNHLSKNAILLLQELLRDVLHAAELSGNSNAPQYQTSTHSNRSIKTISNSSLMLIHPSGGTIE